MRRIRFAGVVISILCAALAGVGSNTSGVLAGGNSLGTSIIDTNDSLDGEPDDDFDKIIYITQGNICYMQF